MILDIWLDADVLRKYLEVNRKYVAVEICFV